METEDDTDAQLEINLRNDKEFAIYKANWVSIKKKKNCLFSRRNGFYGKIILGYSICLRIFGITII